MTYSYLFRDDYSEGAHPRILEALSRTNLQQESGYGADSFAQAAEQLIKTKINKPQAKVHFVATGTQANLVCLSSLLKPFQSVIAVDSGHTNVHEAGALEATGHKLNIVPAVDGKITTEAIQAVIAMHIDEHMVVPKVVYISQATELGTVYSKQELQKIAQLCNKSGLYLYLDGARIGNAIMSKNADFNLQDIADVCDMFYIGGNKNGMLLGEAIVIVNPALQENFRYHLTQRGALLAKTRTISVQFLELFKDNLYFENANHANKMAQKLAAGILECGYEFLNVSPTNQIFPILPNKVIEQLEHKYGFYVWAKNVQDSNESAIRLVTSWATPEDRVDEFLGDIKQLQ